jgi:hypothetical protein
MFARYHFQFQGNLHMAKPLASHGSRWTREDFATIRKLVREGTPTRKIARALGRTLASLYMRASNEGISLAAPKRKASTPTAHRTVKR